MEHVLPPPPPSRPYLATPPPNRPFLQPPHEERQVQSAPPERQPFDEEDPLMGKHSKLYQRRKEIESELRRQFNLPEEAVEVLSQLRSRRSSSYGCPPPVPKPRSGKSKLPPIPKPVEATRGPDEADARAQEAERRSEPPWWKLEQENLARRNQEREAREAFLKSPEPPAEVPSVQVHMLDRSIHLRPQSWRTGRPPAERKVTAEFHAPRPPPEGSQPEEPWRAKARELEALASAHHLKHEELKKARAQELDPMAPEEAMPAQVRYSQEYLKELRQREEQRFEEMKREELRKLQKEREEAQKRREEQEEWEQAMRQQFAQEAARLRAAQKRQQEAEDEQQKYWQQEVERQQAEREARRRRDAEREERHRARQAARAAAQQARHQQMPEPPRVFRAEAPAHNAEHRSSSQPSFSPSAPRPAPRGPPRSPGRAEASSFSSSRKRVRSEQVFREPKVTAGELQAAKSAAMRQLLCLKQNPSREARQKGFKELLRVWHPDKNPESCEVATAVFQMIQAERSRILPK